MTTQEQELLDACKAFEKSVYSALRPADAAYSWKVWLAAWRAAKAIESNNNSK